VNAPHPPPPGWYPDPAGRAPFRYWDGTRWTEHTQQGTAPPPAPTTAPAPITPAAPAPPAWNPAGVPAQPAWNPTAPAAPYATGAPYAPATSRPATPTTGASFVEDLKKFEGFAVVIVGALLFLILSFLPWSSSKVESSEGSENMWGSDAPWLVRGYEINEETVSMALQQIPVDSGSDAIVLLPLVLAAGLVAAAVKLGKQVPHAAEITVGASALLALLMIIEISHVKSATSKGVKILQQAGYRADGSVDFAMYAAAAIAIAMTIAAARSLQAARSKPR